MTELTEKEKINRSIDETEEYLNPASTVDPLYLQVPHLQLWIKDFQTSQGISQKHNMSLPF